MDTRCAGHHGDGQRAERIDGTGLLGWIMTHRTARPVEGQAPDPHLHVHVTFANMVRGVDGRWSTVAAGGRDLHRHAHAADAYLKGRLRAITRERWGIEWDRDERTGAWEIAAVPVELRAVFSKRQGQIAAEVAAKYGLNLAEATTGQQKTAATLSRDAKTTGPGVDLRADWARQARAAGAAPAELVAAAVPGPDATPPQAPSPAEVFDPEHGLTAHAKVTTRADALAAVIDAMPDGLTDLPEAERLTDAVLAQAGHARRLAHVGRVHLTNADRYTTADITDAENTVLEATRDRYARGYATVDPAVTEMAITTYETGAGFDLSAEQRAVLSRLLSAGHGVDAVIGVAGSGKTTIMSVLRAAHEAAGHTVAGASTAAVAAQNLQAESGIPSRTIAGWLWDIDSGGHGLAGIDVLVIDEAAMVDDRQLARLLAHAGRTGTQVIGIGDPKQLRSPGVGTTFDAIHGLVNGPTLTENRRQRDEAECAAVALWRDDRRRDALLALADAGRVHAVDAAADAHAAMLAAWDQTRRDWPDPYDRIDALLMLAGANSDVDSLNAGAQAIGKAAGELPARGRTYRLLDGNRITLHVDDQVMYRINERQRRDGEPDILNGYRGIVTDLHRDGSVEITWRHATPDGPLSRTATVDPAYIARGGVTLAYAMTVHKAQGLTADRAIVYGTGLDPNALYPALTRQRHRVDLYLPTADLESDETKARLGPPRSDAEALRRTVDAYAASLNRRDPEQLVLTQLAEATEAELQLRAAMSRVTAAKAQLVTDPEDRDAKNAVETGQRDAAAAKDRLGSLTELHTAIRAWRTRQYGHLTDAALAREIDRTERAAAAAGLDARHQARAATLHSEQTTRAALHPQLSALQSRDRKRAHAHRAGAWPAQGAAGAHRDWYRFPELGRNRGPELGL